MFKVKIYNRKGIYYASENADTEEESRDLAVRWTTGRGQKSFRAKIIRISPDTAQEVALVATYTNGAEVSP